MPSVGSMEIDGSGTHNLAVVMPFSGAYTTQQKPVYVSAGQSATMSIGLSVPTRWADPGWFAPTFVIPHDIDAIRGKQVYWPVAFDILEKMRSIDISGTNVAIGPEDNYRNADCAVDDIRLNDSDGVCTHLVWKTRHEFTPEVNGRLLADIYEPRSWFLQYDKSQLADAKMVTSGVHPSARNITRYNVNINNPFVQDNEKEQQMAFLRYAYPAGFCDKYKVNYPNVVGPPSWCSNYGNFRGALHRPNAPATDLANIKAAITSSGHVYRFFSGGHKDGTYTIQYWVYYTYNNKTGLGQHEGDWEHVSLEFANGTSRMIGMYFSGHNGVEHKDVNEIEESGSGGDLNGRFHPRVYVAKGSHANYASCGNQWTILKPNKPRDFAANCETGMKGRIYICPPDLGATCAASYTLTSDVPDFDWACWRDDWTPPHSGVGGALGLAAMARGPMTAGQQNEYPYGADGYREQGEKCGNVSTN